MIPTTIPVTMTKDRHDRAVVVLDGSPFDGMVVYPRELRALAATLMRMAEDAEGLGSRWRKFNYTVKVS
jgi:hypothetical protein